MSLVYRIKRCFKELVGQKQWPLVRPVPVVTRDDFFLACLIRPNDVVYDIGANHGSLACFIADRCGVNGKVVAFEPVWRTYERMCERLQAESLSRAPIITVPLGLSDQPEIVDIHLPDGLDALASIAPADQVNKVHASTHTRSLHCGVITLDLFVNTTGIQQPQVVKIDVEGAECKVLNGGRSVWEHAEPPILFMEIVGPWLRKFGNTPWEALGYLQSVGYRHYFMCPDGLVEHTSTQVKPFPEEFRMGYNVISYVPARHVWLKTKLDTYLASKKPVLPPMDPPTLPNC